MADGDCLVSRLLSASVAWIEVSPGDAPIAAAVDRGELVLWKADGQRRATLSPLGAFRAGVELREFGRRETPRWVRRGLPVFAPKVWPESGRTSLSDVAWLLLVADDDRERDDDPPQATVQSPAMMMGVAIGLLKSTARSKKPSKKASKPSRRDRKRLASKG